MIVYAKYTSTKIWNREGRSHTLSPMYRMSYDVFDSLVAVGERGPGYQLKNPNNGYVLASDIRTFPPPPQPVEPPISIPPGKIWVVRGDEELARYDFQSRTLAPDWVYLQQTPSVFRFNPTATDPTLFRTDISSFVDDIFRVNNWTDEVNKSAYLFSPGTALFNGGSYPRQANLTMSGNLLEQIAVEGQFLKFKTVRPGQNVSGMTRATHPQYVHKWDIVTAVKVDGVWVTKHVETPHGKLYWFLASREGYGYIPLEIVKPV